MADVRGSPLAVWVEFPEASVMAPAYAFLRRIAVMGLLLVAVTAWSRDEDKRRAYDSGFDLHVAKPMSVEQLKELLALLDPEHEELESPTPRPDSEWRGR